jgi:S-adenosylmethionine-diacylgycerolhomoserine-N-methlytransferase
MNFHSPTEVSATSAHQRSAMDHMYRFQRHVYDASRRFYLLGRDRLIDSLDVPAGGTVLEIGCGTGRNLIRVARRYPSARIYGFDISDEMLKTARAAIRRSGMEDRILVTQGDALTFDSSLAFGVESFDRVYCSYTLSMIPGWQDALAHAATLLGDRGSLHIADFGQCESLPPAFKWLLFAWLRRFHVHPRGQLPAEAERLAERLGAISQYEAGHRGYDWQLSITTRA